jgi:eukaryotic-like serine/threonine-protein kinase
VSAAQPLMNHGAILSGRWQIQDFVGSGETGEVYGVRDMHSTGTFALKLFWPNALAQAEIWSALQHTARTASGLGVEGVARAYDFGIDANSARPFFVAERIPWSSLADRVRLRGPLTPADMATALEVLGRALDAAHAAGIVHRDLKPENVFVSPENAAWVRISDFGVALLRSASPPPPGWGGTVGWVAPDGADPNARSTPAMDVFAVGLITFFALSGGALHRSARATPIDPGALWQELAAPLDSASLRARELGASLDPAFDAWFQRAVAALPQARFGSVGEMASAFVAIARTLFAPQSQNAVALHGIAAAIAQPLVFQPESLPPPAPRAIDPAPGYGAAAGSVSAQNAPSSEIPGVRKRSAAPLFIGGAVLCFALTAVGAVALYRGRESSAEAAASVAAAAATASASASAALAAAAVSAAVVPSASEAPAASASAAPAAPDATQARALFKCLPQSCEAVVCDGKALPGVESGAVELTPGLHSCSVSRAGFASKAFKLTAKAGEAQTLEFTLTPTTPIAVIPAAKPIASVKPSASAPAKPAVVAAKPAVTPAKPTVAASTKPAAAVASAKPAAAPVKKKCGSVFIPCKGG